MTNTVVHCTAKLGKLLAVKPVPLPENPDTWNAHLFPYNRRKCIIFVHALTGYCLLALDVLKADLRDMPAVFADLLHKQLHGEWPMHTGRIDAWLREQAPAVIAPTNGDKRTLGIINSYIGDIDYVLERHHPPLGRPAAFLEAWNQNTALVGAAKGHGKYIMPGECMASHIGIPYSYADYSGRKSHALHTSDGWAEWLMRRR